MQTEKHSTGLGVYIKDMVYGANDGIITTFAVVAGAAGADLSPAVIIILGISNLLADGFSMAASNYLGTTSEHSLFKEEEKREIDEVENLPDSEKEEVREVFLNKGFSDVDTSQLVNLISKNKNFWVDFMMRYELELSMPSVGGEWKAATMTFLTFVFAGTLPLLPFIVLPVSPAQTLNASVIFTAVSLFLVGSARHFITRKNWFWSGLEMLFVGGIAAVVAYWVGYLVSNLI
ncbi:MAG: VIT1/CCC1 transporter family protein [Candidatus Harrisonbacteria bacterium]|nr:VIT1/CCC1 transporter family protein [Candidatus Harrisonbacteria bacterium]